VRTVQDGDDYGAMYEVLGRRFRRGLAAQKAMEPSAATSAENADDAAQQLEVESAEAIDATAASTWDLPDLFVVDGGRGQLQVALTAAHDLGLFDLPIVGLAKERETAHGDKVVDRVYLPGQKNPIVLRPNSPELFLLARARDEAHRFANRGRKQVGKKWRFESQLDQVPGIGPKTRAALLKTLGTVEGVALASDEAILAIPGVTRRQLDALRKHFAAQLSEAEADDPELPADALDLGADSDESPEADQSDEPEPTPA
jgi:excinuclease ABC subunit C